MTEFLVRKFVKNPEQTEDPQVRSAYGILSSQVGIFCNILLFGGKACNRYFDAQYCGYGRRFQ